MRTDSVQKCELGAATRGLIVQRVLVDGWTPEKAGAQFGVDGRRVARWGAAYRTLGWRRSDGAASLDRSLPDMDWAGLDWGPAARRHSRGKTALRPAFGPGRCAQGPDPTLALVLTARASSKIGSGGIIRPANLALNLNG